MNHVITETARGVARIQMHRPEKKNALTLAMYEELVQALDAGTRDPQVRCLLLTGVPEAFTAGNDLKDFAGQPPATTDAPAFRFMRALFECEKPVVAAVSGLAIGIGVTILPFCEIVFAAENVRFQTPFVDLGLVPEAGSTFTLPWLLGYHKAAEFLLLGKPFGAAEALATGLVNQVVAAEELLPVATAAAEQIAAKPPTAVRNTKKLLRAGWADAAKTAMATEGPLFLEGLKSPEAKEAFAAFFEKRKPDFSKFI